MGKLTRRGLIALAVACLLVGVFTDAALGFSGFGPIRADATYGQEMTFSVGLPGGAPDSLELLLQFTGSDDTLVIPVQPGASSATYRWDAADRSVTPNTLVTYRWRATAAGAVTVSAAGQLLYDDDRTGFDWHTARYGDATVHWYGAAEDEARAFGRLSSSAARSAEELLGHSLAGPIDIFVYDTRDDFFGALGPGAREWTGAATFPPLRTIFMWLGGGSAAYLQTTLIHEVTHVVFHDATDNPFHAPPRWFNEGLATWAEDHSDQARRSTVTDAASGVGLLALDALADQFPIDAQGASLAYAEGDSMIQFIIDRFGDQAIAGIAEAWRNGAGDAEALEVGTGITEERLYHDFFASFGVEVPKPIVAAALAPSNVDKPPQRDASSGPVPASSSPDASPPPATDGDQATLPILLVAAVMVGVLGGLLLVRRAARGGGPQ